MMSSVIPARLVFQCGHAALVSLPRIKGETNSQRAERVAREKSAAQTRACDFCAQRLEVVVQQVAPASPPTPTVVPLVAAVAPVPAAEPVPLRRRLARRNGTAPVKHLDKPAAVTEVKPTSAPPTVPLTPVATAAPNAAAPNAAAPNAAAPSAAAPPLADWHANRMAKAKPRRSAAPRAKSPAQNGAVAALPEAVAAATPKPVAKRSVRNGRAAHGARFTVEFQVQTVVSAADVREALRQVRALGAIEVLAIIREN
jgi:hypothetical protein